MNQVIYDWAVKYRSIGWNVIPLFRFSKNPAPIKWKEFEDRLMTEEEFESFFRQEGVTGLGLVTGSRTGVVVIDEDLYKEGGKRVSLVSPMVSQTARGGRHHYFKYVDPIKTSGFRKGVHVEIKAEGGFVVLPPSEVWIYEMVEKGAYSWLSTCHPDDLPAVKEEQLREFRSSEDEQKAVVLSTHVGVKYGEQHNSLRTLALAILNRFSQKEWDMAAEFVRFEASKYDPPADKAKVEQILRDCMQFIKTHPKEVESELSEEIESPVFVGDLVDERLEDRELEKIAPKTGWPELDEIIKGFVPTHTMTLTGDTNVGKTTLACNFANALWKQEKHTLYIALEPDVMVVEYLASVRFDKRFDQVTTEDLQALKEDKYIHVYRQRTIRTAQDLIKAVKQMKQHYDLIVIDHIGYFVQGEKNWIQEQSNVIKELAILSKAQKTCTMMIAHLRKPSHQKKSEEYIPTQNDILGSGSFKQDSTEVLIATRSIKENGFGVEFSDIGRLIVSKTKAGKNGGLELIFSEGSAKVWSRQEAATNLSGRMYLEQRSLSQFHQAMDATDAFVSDEED